MRVDWTALELLPEDLCRELGAFAFSCSDKELWVALSDLADVPRLQAALEHQGGAARFHRIHPVQLDPVVVQRELASLVWYPPRESKSERGRLPDGVELGSPQVSGNAKGWNSPDIRRAVSLILMQSIKDPASEVQIVPHKKFSQVYFRVDGVLVEVMSPPQWFHASLVFLLRSRARLDNEAKGWLRYELEGKSYSFSIRFLPSRYGEIVLLERACPVQLEYPAAFLEALGQPTGLIVVEAPEGHGLRITFGEVMRATQSRRPIGISVWSCAWSPLPTVWMPPNPTQLCRDLISYQPAVVALEEATAEWDELERLSQQCLVIAGTRDAAHVEDRPTLGVLRQRLIRNRCSRCSGKGCDDCKMTECRGASLLSHWDRDPGPTLREQALAMVERGQATSQEACQAP